MARKRTIAPGTRHYGSKTHYSSETLAKILDEVTSGRIGQREAARKYNIPRQTIVNKLKKKHVGTVGRPTIFSPQEETSFVQHCIAVSDMGVPISLFDLRCIVKAYLDASKRTVSRFANNMPGWEWAQAFLKRRTSELSHKFATNIVRKRALVNEGVIQEFFEHFERESEGIPPENIFNYDETGFHDIPSKSKLLFRRSCRQPEKILNTSKTCYTVMFCGNAAGEFLPPYIIFKGKQKWTDWLSNAPVGTKMNSSDSGWMEQSIFDDWFQLHFLPFARKKVGRKIIIGDNLSSHISMKTLTLCEENDITFICLPPNATHLLQPLDVAYFSSLKSNWRAVLSEWRKTPDGKKKVCLPKSEFSALLSKALELGQNTASSNLVKGFDKCGLVPVNCNRVLEHLPDYSRHEFSVMENVGAEFKNYLESIRSSDLTVKNVRKYKLPVEPGKSVSAEQVRQFYTNREAAKNSGKKIPLEDEMSNFVPDNQEFDPAGEFSASGSRPRSGPKTRGGRRHNHGSTVRILPQSQSSDIASEENILVELNVNSDVLPVNIEHVLIADNESVFEDELLVDMLGKNSSNGSSCMETNTSELDGKFLIGDYVIVSYQGKHFPGKLTAIEVRGQVQTFEVSCMARKGKTWVWPGKEDKIWYHENYLIKKLDESRIKFVNKRGMMQISDPFLCSDEDE